MLLGDSMGEMFAYYAASDVALIGGSLLLAARGYAAIAGRDFVTPDDIRDVARLAGATERGRGRGFLPGELPRAPCSYLLGAFSCAGLLALPLSHAFQGVAFPRFLLQFFF